MRESGLRTDAQPGEAEFPPRGSGRKGVRETPPDARWQDLLKLSEAWTWQEGKIPLGMAGRLIGEPDRKIAGHALLGDDRHLVTMAGTRAGKSSTALIPALLGYPGSMIVLDPKGELARATAAQRAARFDHDVYVIDPYGTSGWESSSYGPLSELDPASESFIDDVGLVADALIIDHEKDPHWTDASKAVLKVIILYMFADGGEVSLLRMRRILLGAEGAL